MIEKLIALVSFILTIIGFTWVAAKRSEKNKQNKQKIKTYEEANKTRKEVDKMSDSDLDAAADELLND